MSFLLYFFAAATLQSGQWQTDPATAKQITVKDHKAIILLFQGSDWCAPCMNLDKEIWQASAFNDLAQYTFVMLRADFLRKRAKVISKERDAANAQLAETYNKKGIFPFAVVLDSTSKKLGEAGSEKIAPQEYYKLRFNFIK
jgi:thioredoxin-related protein